MREKWKVVRSCCGFDRRDEFAAPQRIIWDRHPGTALSAARICLSFSLGFRSTKKQKNWDKDTIGGSARLTAGFLLPKVLSGREPPNPAEKQRGKRKTRLKAGAARFIGASRDICTP